MNEEFLYSPRQIPRFQRGKVFSIPNLNLMRIFHNSRQLGSEPGLLTKEREAPKVQTVQMSWPQNVSYRYLAQLSFSAFSEPQTRRKCIFRGKEASWSWLKFSFFPFRANKINQFSVWEVAVEAAV